MTATNHALTGALIALAIKKPEFAIPLAFMSHFVVDMIPHYNPPKVKKQSFTNFYDNWPKKFASPSFLYIFASDMLLFGLILLVLPLSAPATVSAWTIFFSSLAAASPDFVGGRFLVYRIIGYKPKHIKNSPFTRFHIWLQWMERPWGIWVELAWAILMIWLIYNLMQ